MCNVELVDKRSMFSFNSLQLTTSRLRTFCLFKSKRKIWSYFQFPPLIIVSFLFLKNCMYRERNDYLNRTNYGFEMIVDH